MLELVEPAARHREAILAAVPEMQAVGEWDITPERFAERFDEILEEIARSRDAATAPPGALPHEDFWLMEDGRWLGLLTLRTRLDEEHMRAGGHIGYVVRPSARRQGYGTRLLALGLAEARKRGLARVLLTCAETNVGSRRVIEANGGRLEDSVAVEGQAERTLRFWIALDTPP